jgi:hypothetical protein
MVTRHDDDDAGEQGGGKEGGDFFFCGARKKTFSKRKKRGRLEAGLKRAKLKPYLPENGQLLSLSFYPCVNNKCTIVTV